MTVVHRKGDKTENSLLVEQLLKTVAQTTNGKQRRGMKTECSAAQHNGPWSQKWNKMGGGS